ncbi:MFS transporter [Sphingobacterium sp. SRCM116780]|uniref:MFS transporter n=1 Tax=Sphingobacterium sp. SRCM116780 TaxID=2907623 RepID=UPI001F390CC4|nr:MFS transporter [Sphingobacterium sp. SRCM116780]UIR57679.1 MFS transporter [Sphingobacterium sp. SRCM116780]
MNNSEVRLEPKQQEQKNVEQKINPYTVKDKPLLTRSTLWLMTITTGVVVGNNYYNQPLLGLMAKDFRVTESQISIIAMLTQIGFALGLLFIVPLGDMMRRKKLILVTFSFMTISLIAMTIAPNLGFLCVASFLVGFTSVAPQMFVPMAAEMATPQKRNSAIGMVMSGLLLGILLSRVVSGFVGEIWGWKMIYYIAAVAMITLAALIFIKLPDIHPSFKGNYSKLMKSLIHLTETQPVLRLAAFRGALGFAGFSAFWIALVFHLEEAPFHAGSSVAGLFGLVGAVGALAAAFVGKIATRVPPFNIVLTATILLLISWMILYFGGYTYIGLVVGVILLDLGLQSMHIMNQSSFFALNLGANNRLNTVYMFSYFVGGSLGTFLASQAWKYYQWNGVIGIGIICTLLVLGAHIVYGKNGGGHHLSHG